MEGEEIFIRIWANHTTQAGGVEYHGSDDEMIGLLAAALTRKQEFREFLAQALLVLGEATSLPRGTRTRLVKRLFEMIEEASTREENLP